MSNNISNIAELEEALATLEQQYHSTYRTPESIYALMKTLKTFNITITDWNELIDYVNVVGLTLDALYEVVPGIFTAFSNHSDSKLDKLTPAMLSDNEVAAYVASKSGSTVTQGKMTISGANATAWTIPTRRANGELVIGTPTASNHATTKAYVDGFGYNLEVSIDNSTYVMTLLLKDKNNNTLATRTVDLPLETMVVSGSYNNSTKKIVLTLQSGQSVEFSVADLVVGLLRCSDINITGGAITSININGIDYQIAENVTFNTIPKVVQSVSNLPAANDGFMYLVLDNGYLYIYDTTNGWVQAYQYTSDLLTITEVDGIVED